MNDPLVQTTLASPIGALTLVAAAAGLRELLWEGPAAEAAQAALPDAPAQPILAQAAQELDAYFDGHRRTFEVPLDLHGTPFQQKVWALLQSIPYGTTTTYGTLARQLGGRGKAQAVGLANALNPVAIVVPCHRVLGATGALTGFAGGLDRKLFLLRLERQHRPAPLYPAGQTDLFPGG